jgi:two-component system OmpR family sensor kinase
MSTYRELSPLIMSINHLMARLRRRIEHEHEFLSDAAHELKTPLAAIQINAHLLQTPQRRERGAPAPRSAPACATAWRVPTHLVQQLLSLERARSDAGDDGSSAADCRWRRLVRDRLAVRRAAGFAARHRDRLPCRGQRVIMALHVETVCGAGRQPHQQCDQVFARESGRMCRAGEAARRAAAIVP